MNSTETRGRLAHGLLAVATLLLVGLLLGSAVGPALAQQAPNGTNTTNTTNTTNSTNATNGTTGPAQDFFGNGTNATNTTNGTNGSGGGAGAGAGGSGGFFGVPSAGEIANDVFESIAELFGEALTGLVLLPHIFTLARMNALSSAVPGGGVAGGIWARPGGLFGAVYDIAMESIVWIAFTLFATFLVIDWFGNFRAHPGADGPVDRLLLRAADCLHLLFSWPIAWGHFLLATFLTALFMPGQEEISGTVTEGIGNLGGALGVGASIFVLPLIGVALLWLMFKHGGAFVYLIIGLAAYPALVAASIPDDSRWLGRLGIYMEGARQKYVVAAWWTVPTAVVLGIGYAIDQALLDLITLAEFVPDSLGGVIVYPVLWIAALYAPIKIFSGGTPPSRLRHRTPSMPGGNARTVRAVRHNGGGGGGGAALMGGAAGSALAAGASSGAGAASAGASSAGRAASSFPRLEAPSASMQALSPDGGTTTASAGATTGPGSSVGGDIPGGGGSGGSAFGGGGTGASNGAQYGPGSSQGMGSTAGSDDLSGRALNRNEGVTEVSPQEFDAGQRYEPYVYQGGEFDRIDPPKNAEWLTENGGFKRINEAYDDPVRLKGENDGQFYDLSSAAGSEESFSGSTTTGSTTANTGGTTDIRES